MIKLEGRYYNIELSFDEVLTLENHLIKQRGLRLSRREIALIAKLTEFVEKEIERT